MSIDFIFRLLGMVGFAVLFGMWGASLSQIMHAPIDLYSVVFGLVGALSGLILTPYFTTRPFRNLRARLQQTAPQTLFASLMGLISGLIIAALLSFPLSLLPTPIGEIAPFLGVVLFSYLGVALFAMREHDIMTMFRGITPNRNMVKNLAQPYTQQRSILVDTSVVIDGRILDITRTGFLSGTLLIPRFVLNELQYIADSADTLRRQRGRRGIEVISALQKELNIPVTISDIDVQDVREVDEKLIRLAQKLHCPVLTNDYNLNRVAELQGVIVLNINELANAVKTVLLPGETFEIKVLQEGKEHNQGVGYLEDGTMVVIENGQKYINRRISVEVTKALQTAAGRMVFARSVEKN